MDRPVNDVRLHITVPSFLLIVRLFHSVYSGAESFSIQLERTVAVARFLEKSTIFFFFPSFFPILYFFFFSPKNRKWKFDPLTFFCVSFIQFKRIIIKQIERSKEIEKILIGTIERARADGRVDVDIASDADVFIPTDFHPFACRRRTPWLNRVVSTSLFHFSM